MPASMSGRRELLEDLCNFRTPVANTIAELSQFPWDSAEDIVVLEAHQIATLLHRYLIGDLSATDIEVWADGIECREDIGFEQSCADTIADIVFDLANPALQGELSPARANALLARLSYSVSLSRVAE